ncbi:GGDEF and EAL domain-containing protein [Shewanella sp. VB17]|nr:GGDEF and EAL domain-containing protein [Shewanella sp. VB17]
MTADYLYERNEKRQEAITHEVAHLDLHLVRMQHIVNSALAMQDPARIEQEIALAAADLGVMVYTVLNNQSIIRFSNHLVWRDSQANHIIDGYDFHLHRRVAAERTPQTVVNTQRLSIQAYYPLKTQYQHNQKDIHDLIYVEYDISPLLKNSDHHVQVSFIRFIGVSLIGLLFFLVLLHVYLIRPLRALSVQATNGTKYSNDFFGFHEQPVLAVFSEVVAIQEHLRDFSNMLTHSKKQLNDSQIRWLFAVEISENRIWDWNLVTNEVFLSESWKEMLGYDADELTHEFNTWQELLHPEDKPEALKNLKRYLNNEMKEFESIHRLKHKQGHYIWVLDRGLVVEWDDNGAPIRMIGTHANVSNDVSNQQAIIHQTKHDILTGLANRRALLDEIYALKRHNQHHCSALFVIDLDNFKIINDTLGHHRGDRVLIKVAARLSSHFSNNVVIARLAADEFVLLVKSLGEDAAAANRRTVVLASQIRQMIGRSFDIDNQTLNISVSVGICMLDDLDQMEPEQVLQHANLAMHRAKDKGRDAYAIYSHEMEVMAQNSLWINNELKKAIAKEELSLLFQPIVDKHGVIVCAEVLLRWHHAEKGLISPDDFLPIAEGSGLIEEIGYWVLKETCHFIGRLKDQGVELASVAINVSARQFNQDLYVENMLAEIAENEVAADIIELELTEYALITNLDIIKKKMNMLQEAGVSIAIDDFGTGYSSLNYLQSLPLSRLKLDTTFISKIGENEASDIIVKAIINMAHSLNLKVVAEGVETQAQYAFLQDNNCDTFQGYFFSDPLSEQAFIQAFLNSSHINMSKVVRL